MIMRVYLDRCDGAPSETTASSSRNMSSMLLVNFPNVYSESEICTHCSYGDVTSATLWLPGIPFLSSIRAEIYVISYQLPVNSRHLLFPTYTDVGQYSY